MSTATKPPAPSKPPKSLGPAGRATWALAWAQGWVETPDCRQVEHLCRLEDEAAILCVDLDRDGPTLTKPMISPRGEILGEERYPHPALKSLRQLDKELRELRKSLGLDPQSRARLQLEVEEEATWLHELKAQREARLAKSPKRLAERV
jgi:P27 family predicted phage terminase small subunit